jgi:hypothetical protein
MEASPFSVFFALVVMACFLENVLIFELCCVVFKNTLRLSLASSVFEETNLFSAFNPPLYLAHFHMLQNYVDLLLLRVINDFEKADDIWMSSFLQDCNLSLDFSFMAVVLS